MLGDVGIRVRNRVVSAIRNPNPAGLGKALEGYGAGLVVVVACTGISFAGEGILQLADRILLFPLGVLLIAARFGMGPALFVAVTGVLAFDYLFMPPALTFAVKETRHLLTLAVMLTVTAVISVLVDRLRRQAEMARRQAEVERLRNTLLSALSHDLRTPLAALIGAGTALHEDRVNAEERRALARMVTEEAERLHRLVGTLLELTRLESGRVTVKGGLQAIDEVIGSAMCRLEQRLEGRDVRTSVPEEIPLAAFDPILIEQVVINLVENALRHTPERSPIDVVVRREGETILVEVADRGPGVRPGDEEKVFEPLYRGGNDRADGGIGLGLAICRAILTAHGGRIRLENREGGGAAVRFTLPIDDRVHVMPRAFTELA